MTDYDTGDEEITPWDIMDARLRNIRDRAKDLAAELEQLRELLERLDNKPR